VGSAIEGRLEFLQSQLHAISLATAQARARGDAAAIATLQTLYNKVRADVFALQKEALAADMPSAFMLKLDAFSDQVLQTGVALKDAAVSVAGGIGATFKYLPLLVLVTLVVVGLIYAGKIRKGLK
jgi:hypothetical protein